MTEGPAAAAAAAAAAAENEDEDVIVEGFLSFRERDSWISCEVYLPIIIVLKVR